MTKKETRALLSYVHFLDIYGDGQVAYPELMHAMHVPDLKLPSKQLIKGGQFKMAAASKTQSGATPRATAPPTEEGPERVVEWTLEDYRLPSHPGEKRPPSSVGQKLLIDFENNHVYVYDNGEKWPLLYGRSDTDDFIKLGSKDYPTANEEFLTQLEKDVRIQGVQIRDFLSTYGLEANQSLDANDVKDLVLQIAPGASDSQVLYFLALLGLEEGGERMVLPKDILDGLKQLRTLCPRITKREDSVSIALLNKISDVMVRDQKKAAKAFMENDLEGRGYLIPTDLPRFFKALVPTLKVPQDTRAPVTFMHLMDLEGAGTYEFKTLVCVSCHLDCKRQISADHIQFPSGLPWCPHQDLKQGDHQGPIQSGIRSGWPCSLQH